jgi:hypothetical protein
VNSHYKLLFIYGSWVQPSALLLLLFIGLLYQTRMTDGDDYGTIGGMSDTGNRSTRGKPAPVLLSPPQIPHDLTIEAEPPWWAVAPELRHGTAVRTIKHNTEN